MSILSVKSSDFTIDGTPVTGLAIDGPGYVVADAGGVVLSGLTPARVNDGNGYAYNGFQVNPQENLGKYNNQAFDQRLAILGSSGEKYDATLQAALPITLYPGDIVVHFVGYTYATDLTAADDSRIRDGLTAEVNVLYVVDAVPAAEAFSPGCWGWAGRGTPIWRTLDDTIDNIVAMAPAYPLVGIDAPDMVSLLDTWDHFDPYYGASWNADWKVGGGYESKCVNKGRGLYLNKQANYGDDFGHLVGAVNMSYISDGWTTAQKRRAFIRMISQGIQWAEASFGTGIKLGGNGGHHQFHHAPVALACKHTSLGTLLDLYTNMPGNSMAQAFRITQSHMDTVFVPHDSVSTQPACFARHTLTSVSGNDIQTTAPSGSVKVPGLVLTRESDGATATIISSTHPSTIQYSAQYPNAYFTIDAQPSPPFAANDVVYFDAPWLAAGGVDWNIQAANKVSTISEFQPSWTANYRVQADYSDETMFLKALNMWITEFDAMKELVELSRVANYPTATNDWPEHASPVVSRGGYQGHAYSNDFWNAHWTDINGSPTPTPPAAALKAVVSGGKYYVIGSKIVIG